MTLASKLEDQKAQLMRKKFNEKSKKAKHEITWMYLFKIENRKETSNMSKKDIFNHNQYTCCFPSQYNIVKDLVWLLRRNSVGNKNNSLLRKTLSL